MPKTSSKSAKRKAPWKKPAPRSAKHTHLTPAQKAKAKRSAKRAGRPYPNLVDNMKVAREGSGGGRKKSTAKAATRQATAKKGQRRRRPPRRRPPKRRP